MAYNYPYQTYPQSSYPTQSNNFNALGTPMNVGATQPQNVGNPQMQIQDGGFVTLPSEEMVYTYPVGLGKSVSFKIEGKPIVMEKTVFSQFESPRIKRFRLVEEEAQKSEEKPRETSDIDKLKSDIREIWGKLDEIENSKKNPPRRENKNGES